MKESTISDKNWQIENLFKNAFNRFKSTVLSYYLAFILGFLMLVAVYAVTAILAAIDIGVFGFALRAAPLAIGIAVLLGIAFFMALCYFSSWITLATLNIIMSGSKPGVMDSYKETRPFILGFIWMNILIGLFMGGLLVWGILSIFIVFILWTIWNAFAAYVYLDQHKKGLENVWTSKAMVSSRFWGVVLRLLIVWIASFIISWILGANGRHAGMNVIYVLFSILVAPFTAAYIFEIYLQLAKPTEVKTPTVWITLSIVGWILNIVLIGFIVVTAASSIQHNMKNTPKKMVPSSEYVRGGKPTGDPIIDFINHAAFQYGQYTSGNKDGQIHSY